MYDFDTPLHRAACIGLVPDLSSSITSSRRSSASFGPATTPS
jgi:hypothetical protein